jgi:hypothetical protein
VDVKPRLSVAVYVSLCRNNDFTRALLIAIGGRLRGGGEGGIHREDCEAEAGAATVRSAQLWRTANSRVAMTAP